MLFILTCKIGFSQNTFNTESVDSLNVYHHSLTIFCEPYDHTKVENATLYVEKNLFTDKLPENIGNFKIKYIEKNEQLEIIKQKNGKMILIRIVPLRTEKGVFFVNVIPFHAHLNNGNLELSNGGGLKVDYKYDEKQGGLIYDKATFNGI